MRAQRARIDEMQAAIQKMMRETRVATPQIIVEGGRAMAALIGAGAVLER